MSDATAASSTALIVGASRGLGLGLVREHLRRGWRVIATVRGAGGGPLHDLAAGAGGALEVERVDINLPDQVAGLRRRLEGRALDLLFVNAGVSNTSSKTIHQVSTEEFTHEMVTNALSPMRVVEAFADLVRPAGTIAVMSSVLGSVGANTSGGYEVYRASKAALNTLMRSFAARHKDDSRALLCVHPGWVRTDMGGAAATLDVETSTRGIADVLAEHQGRSGLAYVDYRGEAIEW
jgi:NAD(P)-dependent dehydrogenase (short-subunit alcohol dehydrogenase family)